MDRPINASWTISAEELSVALKLHVLQSNLGIAFQAAAGMACFFIAFALLFVHGTFHWQAWINTFWTLLVSFILWGLVFSQGMAKVVMDQRLRGWPEGQRLCRWTISDDGLASQTGLRSVIWRWDMIRKVVGAKRGALVYPRAAQPAADGLSDDFIWLPRRAFRSEEEYLGFLNLAKSKAESFREVNV